MVHVVDQANEKPWLSPDFEEKFRLALGREMAPSERQFFGLPERILDVEQHEDAA
jgi:hypothetical protein